MERSGTPGLGVRRGSEPSLLDATRFGMLDQQAEDLGFDEFADVWMAVVQTDEGLRVAIGQGRIDDARC